jgi:hypothetical protein
MKKYFADQEPRDQAHGGHLICLGYRNFPLSPLICIDFSLTFVFLVWLFEACYFWFVREYATRCNEEMLLVVGTGCFCLVGSFFAVY